MAGVTGEAVLAAAERVMLRDFAWAECDCCTAACDVFRALHGVDPMQAHRAAYSNALGAARLVARHGGWIAFTDALARAAGLVSVDRPQAGDIGLVIAGDRHSLAVCAGPGFWAAKTMRGFGIVPAAERAWRLA